MSMNLKETAIKKLTNEKSFSRGEKYYKQGRVIEYSDIDDALQAVVVGTDRYKVKIDLTNLDSSCNCMAFRGESFCKHQVAVLLTKVHGEISTAKSPKVKVTSTSRKSHDLQSLKKTECVERSMAKDDYKQLQKQIRQEFKGVSYRRDWYRYVQRLDAIHDDVLQLVEHLPQDRQSCEFLLGQAYWIEEKQLTRLDDSDGIISDLARQLITQAVAYLEKIEHEQVDPELSIIYRFTSKKSSFDFALNVVRAIYGVIDNKTVLAKLGEKIEKTIYTTDSDFAFENKWLHPIYTEYLETSDYDKFLDIAGELAKDDYSIELQLIQAKFNRKEYDQVIRLGWGSLGRSQIAEMVKKSLQKTKQWQKYIDLLKDELQGRFSIETLREIKQICLENLSEKEWEKIVAGLREQNLRRTDTIELLLYLKDYTSLYETIIANPEKDYRGNISTHYIEQYATKLQIIHPQTALKLYKFLIDNELKSFEGDATYYKRFFYYLKVVAKYGEQEYVDDVKKHVVSNFPNKKRLVEQIQDFAVSG